MNRSRVLSLLLAILVLSPGMSRAADDPLSFSFVDPIDTDKLNALHEYQIRFEDTGGATVGVFHRDSYRVKGVAQPSFTYESTVFGYPGGLPVPRARVEKLMADVRALPLDKLPPATESRFGYPGYPVGFGYLDNLDGKKYSFELRIDDPVYRQLREIFTKFLDEILPREQRTIISRTIEGDFAPATPVTFEELFRDPKKYDGKRIRLTGVYEHDFEKSSLGPGKNHRPSEAVWLRSTSSFSKIALSPYYGSAVTVEGTYQAGSGGHMNQWRGELHRISRIEKSPPQE